MRVPITYTLQELQQLTPSLTKEHLLSDKPHIKEILKGLFWRLGCTILEKLEIVEGVTTKNRLGELDDSIRITVYERQDDVYLRSKWASNAVKLATNDVEMMRMIDQHRNQRSFSTEEN